MATVQEVALLKEFAVVPIANSPKTDEELSDLIDEEGSPQKAAGRLWRTYASSIAGLVDVTESGSSRKMSQAYKNALDVASDYDGQASALILDLAGRSRTRPIVRGDVV